MIVTVAKEFIQIDSIDETQLLEWTDSSFTKLAPEGLLDFDCKFRDNAPSLTTATTYVTRKNVIEMAIYLSRMLTFLVDDHDESSTAINADDMTFLPLSRTKFLPLAPRIRKLSP